MYIELMKVGGRPSVQLTPETEEEERILRNAKVPDEELFLVYWGDTEPLGNMLNGLKITFLDKAKEKGLDKEKEEDD